MADTATSAAPVARTERALPFAPRSTACAPSRSARCCSTTAACRSDARRVPRRRHLLRAQRLPDHVAAARRARGTGRIDLLAFWLRRARRLLPGGVPGDRRLASLVAAIFLPGGLGADARRRARLALLRQQLAPAPRRAVLLRRPSSGRRCCSTCGRSPSRSSSTCCGRSRSGSCMAKLGRARTARLTLGLAMRLRAAMAVLFNAGSDPSRVYYGTDTHASALLLGALLAFVWPLGPLRGRAGRAPRSCSTSRALARARARRRGDHRLAATTSRGVYRGGIFVVQRSPRALLIAAVVHPAGRDRAACSGSRRCAGSGGAATGSTCGTGRSWR